MSALTSRAPAGAILIGALVAYGIVTGARAQAPAKTVNTVQTPARATTAGALTLQTLSATSGQADLCVGEVSGAYGNAMLAITLDWTHRDSLCGLLRQSKWAAELGEVDLAREIMCQSADWRSAAARLGRPCLPARSR